MKKERFTQFLEYLKELKIIYDILTFFTTICFFASYFLFYKPSLLCFVYPFNPRTAIFFTIAFLSSFVIVIRIIKDKQVSKETLLSFMINRGLIVIVGELIRWGFLQYQHLGCGNISRWYVYFIDVLVATMIFELIVILIVILLFKKAESKQIKIGIEN